MHESNRIFLFSCRCLGIKSPFIEFKSKFEILSNSSISLNLTQDSNKIPFQKGVQTLDTFINSIDINNKSSSTESNSQQPNFNNLKEDETTTRAAVYSSTTLKNTLSQKAFTNEINEKQVTIIEEQHSGENPLFADDRRERKYIIPLALKTTSNEKEKTSSIFQGSSTNIDDLKKHILMLQNLTINDKSFQSKFVVFPSLQKKDEMTNNTLTQPTELYNKFFSAPTRTTTMPRTTSFRPSFTTQYSVSRTQPTIIKPLEEMFSKPEDILRDTSKEYYRTEKITIIPQVLLQNDQTPVSVDDDTKAKSNNNNKKKDRKMNHSKDSVKRRNLRKNTKRMTTTIKPTMTKRTTRISRNNGGVVGRSYATTITSTANNDCKEIGSNGKCKPATLQKRAREKRDAKFSSRRATNNATATVSGEKGQTVKNQRLNRDIFFPVNNVSGMSKDSMIPDSIWKYLNQSNLNLNENIDLNPENCYKVSGFTEEQKKLCLLHTEIMPSISRGARSAIQVNIWNIPFEIRHSYSIFLCCTLTTITRFFSKIITFLK
jgi:wingless-type MMTV integration site family, member 5